MFATLCMTVGLLNIALSNPIIGLGLMVVGVVNQLTKK